MKFKPGDIIYIDHFLFVVRSSYRTTSIYRCLDLKTSIMHSVSERILSKGKLIELDKLEYILYGISK